VTLLLPVGHSNCCLDGLEEGSVNTALQPRKQPPLYPPPWETDLPILNKTVCTKLQTFHSNISQQTHFLVTDDWRWIQKVTIKLKGKFFNVTRPWHPTLTHAVSTPAISPHPPWRPLLSDSVTFWRWRFVTRHRLRKCSPWDYAGHTAEWLSAQR
jgi:hypothetical protein